MDEKSWIIKNCRFAQTMLEPDENLVIRRLFSMLTKDPDVRHTKADVTRAMREMGLNPLRYQETVATVMGMLVRWYGHRDELKTKQQLGEPNVGKIGQPPVPGRGY
jgi:hypothetical protein